MMAKIIDFHLPKSSAATFIDYEPSKNCCNDDTYGALCVKCEKCGRKFIDGVLLEGGPE